MLGYGVQLREKQKVRRIYGILEGQFRRYFEKAAVKKGITGELLLQYLERRLDNVVHRMGLAASRSQGRQAVRHGHFQVNGRNVHFASVHLAVRHGHFQVNGRKVNIPSYLVKPGDVVEVRPGSRDNKTLLANRDASSRVAIPSWIELDRESLRAKILSNPQRQDIAQPIQEQLIVELYSK